MVILGEMSADKIEIISIGDELLIGQTINTNASWLGQELTGRGYIIDRVTTIADDYDEILSALNDAKSRVALTIITGGLGPTKDDITKHTLCEFFETELVRNSEVLGRITSYFNSRGLEPLEVNNQQADLPKDAVVLDNSRGTASGMMFQKDGFSAMSLPGVPYEMKGILREGGFDLISERLGDPKTLSKTVLTIGKGESFLAKDIAGWENQLRSEGISLAYLPSPGLVKLRLTARNAPKEELNQLIHAKIEELKGIIPDLFVSNGDKKIQQVVGELLLEHNATMSSAESCTGGNIAHLITSVPGSSEYFKGSVVSYSNEIKMGQLGVNEADLDSYGAVSQQVVEQMAFGVRERLNTDYSVATSGIAGPDGGTDEKPVGTVWIAVASKDQIYSEKFMFGRSRSRNIEVSTVWALNLLRKMLIGAI